MMKLNIPFDGKYTLTSEEWLDIAEREMPQEDFYQDGELNEEEALKNLRSLYIHGHVSRVTLAWYEKGRYYDRGN